jgi:integrase
MATRLTAATVEQAKKGKERREIADGGCAGLYLVVFPSGAKSWALRFRAPLARSAADGQRAARKLTLGSAGGKDASAHKPAIGRPLTLVQARKLATDALEQVARGIDPTDVRRTEKAKARETVREDTIDAAMVEFMVRYRGKKTQGLRESTRRLTALHLGLKPDPDDPSKWVKSGHGVLKHWSGRPLSAITKRDAIVLLEGMVDDGHGVSANRVLTVLKTCFAWFLKRDMLVTSPVAMLDAPAQEASRERKLNDVELATLWRAAAAEAYPFGDLVRLLALTGGRRDELREATWSEFDLEGRIWKLPAARSKNNREHIVPLSPLAIDILQKLPRFKGSQLLFTTTLETPISGITRMKIRLDEAMVAEMRKSDPKFVLEPWTLHDLRRTFASGLQRLGFAIEIVEAALNHKSGTLAGVAGIYAKHDYLPEKTKALEAWARHVDGLVNGRAPPKVIPMTARAAK